MDRPEAKSNRHHEYVIEGLEREGQEKDEVIEKLSAALVAMGVDPEAVTGGFHEELRIFNSCLEEVVKVVPEYDQQIEEDPSLSGNIAETFVTYMKGLEIVLEQISEKDVDRQFGNKIDKGNLTELLKFLMKLRDVLINTGLSKDNQEFIDLNAQLIVSLTSTV